MQRETGESSPWFKDGFNLSNVGKAESQFRSLERSDDPIRNDDQEPEDRYREVNASTECSNCGENLFAHESRQCKHCDEVFCLEHVSHHRDSCPEAPKQSRSNRSSPDSSSRWDSYGRQKRKQKSKKIEQAAKRAEEKRTPDYEPTPDVAVDGSVVHPDNEEEHESGTTSESETRVLSRRLIQFLLVVLLFGLLVFGMYWLS